jgi:hypothetical protein
MRKNRRATLTGAGPTPTILALSVETLRLKTVRLKQKLVGRAQRLRSRWEFKFTESLPGGTLAPRRLAWRLGGSHA